MIAPQAHREIRVWTNQRSGVTHRVVPTPKLVNHEGISAVSRKAHLENLAGRLQVSNWLGFRRKQLRERNIEVRLKELENRVESLAAGAYLAWLTDSTRVCEVTEELRAKAEALSWMSRVAQRYSAADRELILLAVEKSLDDLEKTVESTVHLFSIASHGEPTCGAHHAGDVTQEGQTPMI